MEEKDQMVKKQEDLEMTIKNLSQKQEYMSEKLVKI